MRYRQFLEYVRNTAGNATVAHFDEDWEPVGPFVRREIMPDLVITDDAGFLLLTDQGRAALEQDG